MARSDEASGQIQVDEGTPVNPYSLLEAVNNSSDTAHTAWLIFLGIMSYLVISVAGIGHKDLLLNNDIGLPILQVKIELTRFFLFAPIVLVLFHLGVLSQLVLLARKTLELDQAMRRLEPTSRRTHPLRLELHNFFFVQAIAGPERSAIMSAFLHGMTWLTLAILPVVLLLYVQVVFLPYHDEVITWAHRIALGFDVSMLILIGVFLFRTETSFIRAFLRTGRQHPLSFLVTAVILAFVSAFSFLVATIPGEPLDRLSQAIAGPRLKHAAERDGYMVGFILPFVGASSDGSLFGLFHRNLTVTDTDLVIDKDVSGDEPSLNLRGRDLRYARLDRSDLHQADLTGANLDGASLVGTDLRRVSMQCGDLNELLLSENRRRARCTSARFANFSKARLSQARLVGIDLTGAKAEEAQLQDAQLAYATMVGANLASAQLQRADLTGGVNLAGANFLVAALQGADLTGAKLFYADFSSAGLQGALLMYARLEGAILRDADLEGASLQRARLHGAEMHGARLDAADLQAVTIWMTSAPNLDGAPLADGRQMIMKPLEKTEEVALAELIKRIPEAGVRKQVGEALAGVLDSDNAPRWGWSDDAQAWQKFIAASGTRADPAYSPQLTEALSRLMCRSRWSDGSVATGVARRAQAQQFRADAATLGASLRNGQCSAATRISPDLIAKLAAIADKR